MKHANTMYVAMEPDPDEDEPDYTWDESNYYHANFSSKESRAPPQAITIATPPSSSSVVVA